MAEIEMTPDWLQFITPGEAESDYHDGIGTDELTDEPLQPFEPLGLAGMGTLTPRDYQTECVEAIFRNLQEHRSTLAVLATGLGKTVIAAEVAMMWPETSGRVLFIAHRKELIEQAAASIGLHIDEDCGIEMGQQSEARRGRLVKRGKVIVGSVQTLSRPNRLQAFDPHQFGLVITDEAHHATANTYKTVYGYFQQNRQCRFLGITATPDRADECKLGEIFETTAYRKDICDGIDGGWLVPIVQQFVYVKGLDFASVRTTAGDLNERDLERAMAGANRDELADVDATELTPEQIEAREENERMLAAVAVPAIREANGKPGIVFGVTINHAEGLARMLRQHHCTAEAVTQDTDSDTRARIVSDFKAGKLQWLVGVGVFTEGFDAPNAEIVVVARPTKSRALYTQMIGRGTRPARGVIDGVESPDQRRAAIATSAKPNCKVLDFVGNSGRHKLISTADILGDSYPEDLRQAVLDRLRSLSEACDMRAELAAESQRREEMAKLKAEREEAERLAAERRLEELRQRCIAEARGKLRQATATYTTEDVDPFGDAAAYQRPVNAPARGTCTDKQLEYLVKLGVSRDKAAVFSKQQAGSVIDSLSAKVGGEFRITFGKHAGQSLAMAGDGFVWWVQNRMDDGPRRTQLLDNIALMRAERQAIAAQPGD